MAKIAIADPTVNGAAIALLQGYGHEMGVPLNEADAGLIRSAIPNYADLGKNFVAFARCGTGWDNLEHLTQYGVCIVTALGANAPDVADVWLGHMLERHRNINAARHYAHTAYRVPVPGEEGKFEILEQDVFRKKFENEKGQFRGRRLRDSRLTVIGAGHVGMEVIERARAPFHNMTVTALDINWRSKNKARAIELGVKIAESEEEAYAGADVVTYHVPEDATTKGLICERTLAMMPKKVLVFNLAREGICNVDDMRRLLLSGSVGHYYTDLPHVGFDGCPNVTMTPHTCAETEEAQIAAGVLAAERLHSFLSSGSTEGSVNFPIVEAPTNGAVMRLCIPHQANIAGVLAGITDCISAADISVDDITRHKGNLAVSFLDLDKIAPDELLQEISALPHVHRVHACRLA